ncbi:conserved hypothetical protein [Aspergillus terreus NIH2624]|uniref:Transmembrane protein 135 N-terminal domain-containing protein n=1 Tax=Aspergillus terreus (strain NIH 2624 / FGSC A1156) TaxID=341663 RepID=Q0CPC3_ASPTN|nr:uncharacterized protein ATEG_04461 [Aspergillus terreus NIH2624]EAU34908.1 conserved hypothetical protein [Aspergillus terreus NIH2624]
MASGSPSSVPPPDSSPQVHPVVRNALRISLSAKEYKLLHDYAARRAPGLQAQLPSPAKFEAIVRSKSKYNEASVRASIRVFLLSGALLKVLELVLRRLRKEPSPKATSRTSVFRSPNFRLSLSFSLVLLLHRLLYRFFTRLRANLRTDDAEPFRIRNPRVSKALTSRFAPAVGASVAGFALGICPQEQLRRGLAIYMATRSLDFFYNVLDEKGYLQNRPEWFGSWLLMPVSCAQLFHAFVFDREAAPNWFGKLLLNSKAYIQERPETVGPGVAWPAKEEIVDSLAAIASLRWPAFVSPILHPGDPKTLPSAVKSISPITGPAHPSIQSLSCALMHPSNPSCGTAFLHHILLTVPPLARMLATATLAISALKFKSFMAQPITTANKVSKQIISLTAVLSSSAGLAWGSLCLWNALLPRKMLPTKRFYLSGALAGVPFAVLTHSRSMYLAIFRAAVDSAWKTGVKRRRWTGWKGGDLMIVVLSWALAGAILESRPAAVEGAGVRKSLAWMRGDGFVDPVEGKKKRKKHDE